MFGAVFSHVDDGVGTSPGMRTWFSPAVMDFESEGSQGSWWSTCDYSANSLD